MKAYTGRKGTAAFILDLHLKYIITYFTHSTVTNSLL